MTPDVSGEWWSLSLATGWEAEVDEYCVTIAQPDGVGALQVSAYKKRDGSIASRDDLLEATELEPHQFQHLGELSCGDFHGFQLVYAQGDVFWRRFWLANGEVMVFVTYNCEKQHQDQELAPVNEMLASLRSLATD